MNKIFKVKKSITTPMSLAVLLSIPVFYDVFISGHEIKVLILAGILMLCFYLLTLNNLLRQVIITEQAIRLRSLSGVKYIARQDITLIDGVTIGTRQFVTLSAGGRNHLIPNSFDNFANLITGLIDITDETQQGEGLLALPGHLIQRRSDSTGAWITVLILLLILGMRLFPL